MSQRTWVIVNPAARSGRAERDWPALAARLRQTGLNFTACVTCGPGDAVRCAQAALDDGADLLIAVGGDGTLNEVVNGCLAPGRETVPSPTIALIPAGTGADFARTLGLTGVEQAIATLKQGVPHPIDVGQIVYQDDTGAKQERYFVNVADCGLGRPANDAISRGPKAIGPLAYLYGACVSIAGYAPSAVHLEIDGEHAYSGPAAIIAIANGRFFGGGMKVAPKARLDDGLFDIGLVEGVSRATLVTQVLPRVYRGSHLRHRAVHFYRGCHVSITAATPFLLEADGESIGGVPAHFTLLPRALQILMPPG